MSERTPKQNWTLLLSLGEGLNGQLMGEVSLLFKHIYVSISNSLSCNDAIIAFIWSLLMYDIFPYKQLIE